MLFSHVKSMLFTREQFMLLLIPTTIMIVEFGACLDVLGIKIIIIIVNLYVPTVEDQELWLQLHTMQY